MKYLVLRQFKSYGVTYRKGDIVDEKNIKTPHLKVSEGKIVEAVSSFEVPVGAISVASTESSNEANIEEPSKPILRFHR